MAVNRAPVVIHKLDEDVVNKIAAGEVIQRPANALKEMVENSLDAGSSNIQVTVKQGGLKLLQIQDNGHGIRREDMDIVCERFTTSKLKTFEDLGQISTYGFRGEALASISHVAHVTILTRTKDAPCAYKGLYSESRLKGPVRPCAGNVGTQITVEDLFYNMPIRRKALRNPAEEHAKIADVIGKYAIHNSLVSFSLKKYGESMAEIRTSADSTPVDNIRIVYGPSVARECLQLQHSEHRLRLKINGCLTNANYSVKKPQFILFINHRLVESTALRKALDQVYAAYLPKNTHPFVYLSLEMDSTSVDVNVHPTKHEVHFLHEDAIIEACQKAVDQRLLGSNESRAFYTQTLLPGSVPVAKPDETEKSPAYPQHMVRTDPLAQKLDKFFHKSGNQGDHTDEKNEDSPMTKIANESGVMTSLNEEKNSVTYIGPEKCISECSETTRKRPHSESDFPAPQRREIKLASIIKLRNNITHNTHSGLTEIFRRYTFVGCVDEEFSLLQHETKLYLINMTKITREFFYQLMLEDFGNFGFICLSEPAPLYDLAMIALEMEESGYKEENGSREDLAKFVEKTLMERADMLLDYFSMEIDSDGRLVALPLLMENYFPILDGLPMFVLNVSSNVDWQNEERCFHTFCREISDFYALKRDLLGGAEPADGNWKWRVEHVLLPAMRRSFKPPNTAADDASVLQIASLPDLYKVFERC